jgi:hypothetical protein
MGCRAHLAAPSTSCGFCPPASSISEAVEQLRALGLVGLLGVLSRGSVRSMLLGVLRFRRVEVQRLVIV